VAAALVEVRRKMTGAYLRLFVSTLSAFAFACVTNSSLALDSSDNEAIQAKLSTLNSKILHKELELEKSNIRFLLKSHPEGRFKAWRYLLFQETDAALLEAGLLVGIADRHHQLVHGGKIKSVLLEDSLVPQMIGQFTGPIGDLLELGLNARQALKAHKMGIDAGQSKRLALQLHRELLDMLQERESLIEKSPVLATPLAAAETRVMRDEEHLVWLQYSRSLLESKKLMATENTFYALDIFKNLTGALGNLVGLVATQDSEPRLNIGANTLTTVSGAFIMTNPVTSRLCGRLMAKLNSRGLDTNYRKDMHGAMASLTIDASTMQNVYQSNGATASAQDRVLLTRVELYSKHLERASRYVQSQNAEDRKANTAALGRVAVGLLAGSTKVASGTCGIIAADRLGDHAAAALLLGGTTAYASGTDLTLADTLVINVKRERRYQNQQKNGTTVKDVLSSELSDLDKLDEHLTKVESER